MPRRVTNHRGEPQEMPQTVTNGVRCDRLTPTQVVYPQPNTSETEPNMENQDSTDKIHYPHSITCTRTANQRANVSVPVSVKPFSFAGPTTTLCSSDPIIKDIRCVGKNNRVCYFTISQEICVEVPIHFGAEAFLN